MGTWGVSLYSGDFAMDLRGTIGAVARLPFDGDRLAEILCQTQAGAANNPNNEDHTVFWLVTADQFAKRGIVCERVRERAFSIIDTGTDLAMAAKLGMCPADLEKRRRMLAELRTRIAAVPSTAKPRTVLKKPQPFLMESGEVFAYPTSNGECINSYYPSKEKIPSWQQNGWGALVIVDRGRAFEFLAWYRPLTLANALPEKPTMETLRGESRWVLRSHGTCSPVHFKRLELERIGSVSIDRDKLKAVFPPMVPGIWAATADVSIGNNLNAAPAAANYIEGRLTSGRKPPSIAHLDDILANPA